MKLVRRYGLAVGLFLAALAPRLSGQGFGLPGAEHHFSYHPDEYNVLRSLGAMRPAELDFNPRYFHNPSLYYYACGASLFLARSLGVIPRLDREMFHQDPRSVARLYRIGRSLSAGFGALSVALLFWFLRPSHGTRSALLASALMAFSPAHLVLSHYMDVDALLGLFAVLALGCSMHALRSPTTRAAVLCGVVAGLGMGTKYNGVLLLLPGLAATLATKERRRVRTVLLLLSAAAAFLAATPYALLDPARFLDGIRYVLAERVSGRWTGLGHGLAYPLLSTWPWLVGEAGVLLSAIGLGWGLCSRRSSLMPAALLATATYASVAASGTDYVRYSLPALPALACGLAFLTGPAFQSATARRLSELAALAALSVALLRSGSLLRLMQGPDVRDLASAYLERTLPSGAELLVPREPYFHSPGRVFMDYFYRGRSQAFQVTGPGFRVRSADWSPASLLPPDPAALVVVSEHELLYPATSHSGTGRFFDALLNTGRYVELARFDRPARLGPLQLEGALPEPGWQYTPARASRIRDTRLPHDLKYLNPAVLVYELAGDDRAP